MRDFIGCSVVWGIVALMAVAVNYFLHRNFAISSSGSLIISFFLALTIWFIGLFALIAIQTKRNKR